MKKALYPMKLLKNIFSWYFSRSALPYWCILALDNIVVLLSGLFCYYFEHGGLEFARHFWPVLAALVPPLFFGGDWNRWITSALTFLVISCPCALVISVPLTFFSGIGGASRRGILIKGAGYLETLAQTEIAVFDKTGTVTRGSFSVTDVHAENGDAQGLLSLAAAAEAFSTHPIAQSQIGRAHV